MYKDFYNRKDFISRIAGGLAAAISLPPILNKAMLMENKIKAIAFDAFPIFNHGPVANLATSLYPEKGADLSTVWKTKQFEYSWLRTAGGQFSNFWDITEDALVFAAKKAGVELSVSNKKKLMEQFLALPVWPDVITALETLKKNGIRLSFLSNMTGNMLDSCIKNAGIKDYFETVVSTEKAKTYKPSPVAYQLAIESFRLKKEEILFAAFAGWDVSGSKWFGFPSFWVNRLNAPVEELNAIPDGVGKGLPDLINFMQLSGSN